MTKGVVSMGAGCRVPGAGPRVRLRCAGGGAGRAASIPVPAAAARSRLGDVEFTFVLRAPDHEAAGVEDPGRAAVPVPGRSIGTLAVLGAMADLSGQPNLTRVARLVAGGGSTASVGFL